MSTKLVRSFTDDNTDLHEQNGCMHGILQLFDRHHFHSGGRMKNDNPKRLPPGRSCSRGNKHSKASKLAAKDNQDIVKEKQTVSTESSRSSFSSSSWSSSFSSLDCSKTVQLEQSLSQGNFAENASRDPLVNQPPLWRPDFRDVIKDSIRREGRGLSVLTATTEKATSRGVKHIDSPRPVQQPKSLKLTAPGLNEPLHGLVKLRESTWKSEDVKNDSLSLTIRDGPRYSYDGRDLRESFKSSERCKELPRLSLDSKQGSIKDTMLKIYSSYPPGELQEGKGNYSRKMSQLQDPENYRRPSSVVAKLMGLEAFPSDDDAQTGPEEARKAEHRAPSSKLSKSLDEKRKNQPPGSPKKSITPKFVDTGSVLKSFQSSKILKEPAHRRQPVQTNDPGSPAPTTASNSFPSVYSEIEKRLEVLEFQKSGRNLRALKQTLEAMQKRKEGIENRMDVNLSRAASERNCSRTNRSLDLASPRRSRRSGAISADVKDTSSPRSSISSVVTAKQAAENASSASSRIISDCPSGLRKLRTSDAVDNIHELVSKQTNKEPTSRNNPKESPGLSPRSMNNSILCKTSNKSKVPRETAEDSFTKSPRSSGNVSPRLQQKKAILEKHSHSATSSNSSGTRKQFSRQTIDSGSPRRKSKPKTRSVERDKISNNVRDQSQQNGMISHQTSSAVGSALHSKTQTRITNGNEKISCEQPGKIQKNPVMFIEERGTEPNAVVTLEQTSPVSVLETTIYRDESPSSVQKKSKTLNGEQVRESDKTGLNAVDVNHLSHNRKPHLSTEVIQKNTESTLLSIPDIEETVSACETSSTNYTPPLSEKTKPDHRYIFEIMLASGLLKDLDQSLSPLQLHPSGQLIDPKLFLILEETKTSTWVSNAKNSNRETDQKSSCEKIGRQMLFDAVNEILVQKLSQDYSLKWMFSTNKLAGRKLSEQLFLDLCTEINKLQTNKSYYGDDGDNSKKILWQDMKTESPTWTECKHEILGVVLDVERLIFKDLIDEVVSGEVLQKGARQLCRQLFC